MQLDFDLLQLHFVALIILIRALGRIRHYRVMIRFGLIIVILMICLISQDMTTPQDTRFLNGFQFCHLAPCRVSFSASSDCCWICTSCIHLHDLSWAERSQPLACGTTLTFPVFSSSRWFWVCWATLAGLNAHTHTVQYILCMFIYTNTFVILHNVRLFMWADYDKHY